MRKEALSGGTGDGDCPLFTNGAGDGDERNGLINHSPVYGKYEDDVTGNPPMRCCKKAFRPVPSSK